MIEIIEEFPTETVTNFTTTNSVEGIDKWMKRQDEKGRIYRKEIKKTKEERKKELKEIERT